MSETCRLVVTNAQQLTTVEICCGSMGDCNFPERPEDLVPWGKSIRGKEPIPQWVFEMIEMLRENEEEVVIRDTGRVRKCKYRVLTIHDLKDTAACSWIHYEKVSQMIPSNLIATGDSVMRVNPIYGSVQNGMSHFMRAEQVLVDKAVQRHV